MNFIRYHKRFLCSTINPVPYFAEQLTNRDLLRVEGQEVVTFLQGLVTNDVNHLVRGSSSMYTMFLNKAGRVMCDSIIYRTSKDDKFLIECDRSISNDLIRHLRLFRVRKKVEIDTVGSDYYTWIVFNKSLDKHNLITDENILICNDPRLKSIGTRIILPNSYDINALGKLLSSNCISTTPDNDYKLHRYRLGIGEGTNELPPLKCFPLEANCDYLHGISFHKGCYLGQELTARVHHTGVVRKRLMPVISTKPIDKNASEVKLMNGSKVGVIRGIKNNTALSLMRIEHVFKSEDFFIDGNKVDIVVPDWWPKEFHKMGLRMIK